MAYEQLLSEGYIEAVPCRGYFVAQVEDLWHLETAPARDEKSGPEEKKRQAYRFDFTPME